MLYSFNGNDLYAPLGPVLVGKGGVLYGTAYYSGAQVPLGGVCQLTPPAKGQTAWTETDLYSFQDAADGANPTAGLFMDASGALYGTATHGGAACSYNRYGCTTVFKLTPPSGGGTAWTETTIYAFTGPDGYAPASTLVANGNGVLYGTTTQGGQGQFTLGVVFSLTPPANSGSTWSQSVLCTCPGGTGCSGATDGVIFGPGGALYATSSIGGANGQGSVFKLTPVSGGTGCTESDIYDFQFKDGDGEGPSANVVFDAAGNMYGPTAGSGAYTYDGAVFTISP